MASYQSDKGRWSNYLNLKEYNTNVLKIPVVSAANYQVVPQYKKTNYVNPDYESLTSKSGNNYASVAQAYPDESQVQVKYVRRQCN